MELELGWQGPGGLSPEGTEEPQKGLEQGQQGQVGAFGRSLGLPCG